MLPSAVLLQPDDDLHRSVLILHDAIHQEGIRTQLAQFFSEQTPNLNAETFLTAANALGDKQKELTLHFIAPSLPVFIDKIVMGENRADERDGEQKKLDNSLWKLTSRYFRDGRNFRRS